MAFAENALFKSYGVIYLPWLPSTLPDELSTDIRNSSRFLSRQRVSAFNSSFDMLGDSMLRGFCTIVLHYKEIGYEANSGPDTCHSGFVPGREYVPADFLR